jgi:transposase InsO family protein
MLHSERFVDQAPAEIYATLLDEGRYLCSIRTMYRILAKQHEIRERRNQLRHPNYIKPELLARAPNQVWSWDITKLKGPAKWTYFYLYVIIDILSRYVVGWMVAHRESATLAERLIRETIEKQGIAPKATLLAAYAREVNNVCTACLLDAVVRKEKLGVWKVRRTKAQRSRHQTHVCDQELHSSGVKAI